MRVQKNVKWLRHHTEQYRSATNNMCEGIEDFEEVEKLGQGFSSADPLEEIDIEDGITTCQGLVPQVLQAVGYSPTNLDTTSFPPVANSWEPSTPY
jgi:hypothetical protein